MDRHPRGRQQGRSPTVKLRHRFGYLVVSCVFLAGVAVAQDAVTESSTEAEFVRFDTLKLRAEQGDAAAQAELGERYAKGKGTPQDFERAAFWRERAAKQGIAQAQNALGKQYAAGLGVPRSNETALTWMRRAALGDNPDFWFDVAVLFEQDGGDEALREASAWHTRAVDGGHVSAHAHLGLMYFNGQGVTQDFARAAELLGYAADRGDARAQNNLGLMLSQGRGVEQDYEKAVELFQSAADQGLKEAFTNLGVMYENGFGVEFDEARAAELYRKARLQGSLEGALQQIGFLQDPRIALAAPDELPRLLREAALGDAVSQFQSGYLMLGSDTIRADYLNSVNLFGKAAANGISVAMTNLGLLYFRGLGVPQDYVVGFMWVSLGASSGRERLIEVRDYLAGFLTASQINETQTMIREYRSKQ